MRTWKDILFVQYGKRITENILSLVRMDRNGELIQHSLISQVVASTGMVIKYELRSKFLNCHVSTIARQCRRVWSNL